MKTEKESVMNRIKDLQNFMFEKVPAMIGDINLDMSRYIAEIRMPINAALIEISMGLSMTQNKKGEVFKWGPKPTMSEISDLAMSLDSFIEKVERPFYKKIEESLDIDDEEDEDLDIIPEEGDDNAASVPPVVTCEMQRLLSGKLTRKSVMTDYKSSLSKGTIKPSHLPQLYEAGKKLRNRKYLIISGTVIGGVLAAIGIGTAIYIGLTGAGKKTDTDIDNTNDIDIPDPDIDIDVPDDVDIPEDIDIDIPEDIDVPEVVI